MAKETKGLRDIHTHFVYGVDDGAKTAEVMRDMLDDACKNGITALYATSHWTPGMQHFPQNLYAEHLEEARAYCREQGYDMQLYPGAELLYTPALCNYLERYPLQTMGDTDLVLVEFVPDVPFSEIESAVSLVQEYGYQPILAHIERYDCLYHPRVFRLKERYGVRYQVNGGTILKGRGFWKDRHIRRWLREELIDYVASDMHDCDRRSNQMMNVRKTLEESCREEYLRQLMDDPGNGRL